MASNLQSISHIMALLVVAGQVAIGVTLILWWSGSSQPLLRFLSRKAVLLGFIVSLSGLAGSFFYSEIAGFAPCVLCWVQRIALGMLCLLYGVRFFADKAALRIFSLVLCWAGFAVAAYNSYLQFGGSEIIPCPAFGPSCAVRYVFEYGYVTIPLMSLTIFAFLLVFLHIERKFTQFGGSLEGLSDK